MAKPKTLKDSETISLVITKEQREWLFHQAATIQIREGRRVSLSEVVRSLIDEKIDGKMQENEGEEAPQAA